VLDIFFRTFTTFTKERFFSVSGNCKIVRFKWRSYFWDSSGGVISPFVTYHFLLPTLYCLFYVLFPCIPHFFGIPAHISRPLALASPYPSDFVTFISIRYQELYRLLIYTKTIQNDEKHA